MYMSYNILYKYVSYIIYILFHILFHYGLLQDIEYSFLCYTVGPYCLSILYTENFLILNPQKVDYVLGWPKSSFGVFYNILRKNSNKLFGQPNITDNSF